MSRRLIALVLMLGGCREDTDNKIAVFAASSLTELLPSAGGADATYSFESSARLAKSIEAGAPADVFVSADVAWMDHLEKRGLVTDRFVLVRNRLVVVVPVDAPVVPAGPADLARVQRLALAGESVPAGRYARAALTSAGVLDALAAKVVNGDNVRTALGWVARGEADAAIVYATDARVDPRVKVAFVLSEASHPPIEYVAAAAAASPDLASARAFLARLRGPEARAAFEAAGFQAP